MSSRRGDLYRDGVRQPLDTRLTVDQLQLRLGHAFAWCAHPSFAYAQLAQRHLEPGGTLSSLDHGSGLGDLTLVLATWPYADRQLGRYAAVAGYITLPTGSYDAKRTLSLNINPGENRYQAAVQAGYSQRLGSRGNVMTAFDAQWFGDNDAYLHGSNRIGTLQHRLSWCRPVQGNGRHRRGHFQTGRSGDVSGQGEWSRSSLDLYRRLCRSGTADPSPKEEGRERGQHFADPG